MLKMSTQRKENKMCLCDESEEVSYSHYVSENSLTTANGTFRQTELGRNSKPLWANEKPLKYPFIEVDTDYLKFPRNQLYRQNSELAILVADPSQHINVSLTKVPSRSRTRLETQPKTDVRELPRPTAERDSNSSPQSEDEKELTVAISKPDVRTHIQVKAVIHSQPAETEISSPIEQLPTSPGQHSNTIISKLTDDQSMPLPNDIAVIGHRLLDVSKGSEFLLSDVDKVYSILSSDQLEVIDESVVFRAAHRWLRFDPKARLRYADRVMGCVRFGLIKPKDLVKCYARSRKHGLLENPVFCERLFVGLLWSTAAHYGLKHLIPELKPEPRNAYVASLSGEIPPLASGSSSDVSLVAYLPTSSSGNVENETLNRSSTSVDNQSTSVASQSTVLLIGGLSAACSHARSFLIPGSQILCYVHSSNAWQDLQPLPLPLCYAAACYVESSDSSVSGLYLAGGCSPRKYTDSSSRLLPISYFWKYQPETTLWSRLADMHEARMKHALVWLPTKNDGDIRILAIGGTDIRNRILSEVEAYNPVLNVWEHVIDMPRPRYHMAAVYHDGQVWVCGGYSDKVVSSGKYWIVDTVLSLKWSERKWSVQTSLRVPRAQASLVSHRDKLYIVGGKTYSRGKEIVLSSIDYLAPDFTSWKHLTDLPTPRYGAASFINKGKRLVVIGGMKSAVVGLKMLSSSVVESYDLEERRWVSDVAKLPRSINDGVCWVNVPFEIVGY